MTRTLRIGHGNGHNKPSLVHFARQADADSFSCNEAQHLARKLGKIRTHRALTIGQGFTDRRAGSTIMLTRRDRENLGDHTHKVSERIPTALRVAPDRVMLAVTYKHPVASALGFAGVYHGGLHLVAGPRKLNDPKAHRSAIVREYEEGVISAEHCLEWARTEGFLRILTGDLQVRERNTLPWSPTLMAGRQDMAVHTEGIDWLIHDPELHLKRVDTRDLFDHTGFVATLVAAPIKEKP